MRILNALTTYGDSGEGDVCSRVDETNTADRILRRILEQIERAAFVIVDLTELISNVFFELGFAEGLGKP